MKFPISFLLLITTITLHAQPGTPDSSFGTGGKVLENTSVPHLNIIDAVLQTNDKTIVLAQAEYSGINRPVLLRYNTDGTKDSSFSSNGIADSLIVPGKIMEPAAIKLQPDGKILVCGHVDSTGYNGFVSRYNVDGSLDDTFGTNGIFYIAVAYRENIGNLAVLASGKIMLLFSNYTDYSNPYDLALRRLNSNGSPDNSFGTNGKVLIDASGSNYGAYYNKIEVQADGKLVIGGNPQEYPYPAQPIGFILVRVNANGTLDNTYGTSGKVKFDPGTDQYDDFLDMAIQPDGKIIACGIGKGYDRIDYAYILRINTNGFLDNTFGTGGKQFINGITTGFYITSLNGVSSNPSNTGTLSLQADGKIILAGMSKNTSGNYTMAIARLSTAGMLDNSFDSDGIAILPVNEYNSYAVTPVQQGDGKIIVAGFARNGNGYSATIGRFTSTGGADATINAAAITRIGSNKGEETGVNILVQPDQKIVNVRARYNGVKYELNVSRHLNNGIPDNTYGNTGNTFIDVPGGFFYQYTFSGLQNNGKLMIAGRYEDIATGGKIGLLRVNSNGNADSSFGLNGRLFIVTNTTNNNFINDVSHAAFQTDNKILLITRQQSIASNLSDTGFLVRLNPDGSFDNTFNGNGKRVMTDFGYERVAVQSDGKIVISGKFLTSTVYHTYVRRLHANGIIDNTFNNGMLADVSLATDELTLQPDGKVLLTSNHGSFQVARLNSNGKADSTFGTAGIANLSNYLPGTPETVSITAAVVNDGKIVMNADYYVSSTDKKYTMVLRLKATGQPDSTFGTNGFVLLSDINSTGNSMPLAMQADGKIVVAGSTDSTTLSLTYVFLDDFEMVRLNSSGPTGGRVYTFTGSGNWSNPANWGDGILPPATIMAGNSIIIDPPTGSECVVDIMVQVQAGASVTIKSGKKVRLPGNLIIQ